MVFQKKIIQQQEEQPEPKVVKQMETWKVMNVPSAVEPAIVNEETEEVLTILAGIAKILNELEHVKKALG